MRYSSWLRLGTRVGVWGWVCLVTLALSRGGYADSNHSVHEPARRAASCQVAGASSRFFAHLPKHFQLPDAADQVGWRVLADYGAMLVAGEGVTHPPFVVFPDEASVASWQGKLTIRKATIKCIPIQLQAPAMDALFVARTEAAWQGLTITPRGRDSARRDYKLTVELWLSRVLPGLDYWVRQGRLSRKEADRLRQLSPRDQVPEILGLEEQGLFFSQDLSKSILYSVAAPGSSQHLSLLALDVTEHGNPAVRTVLARHGWFQTVVSDLPHFTFLGLEEQDLPARGLKRVTIQGREFWVPDIPASGMRVRKYVNSSSITDERIR